MMEHISFNEKKLNGSKEIRAHYVVLVESSKDGGNLGYYCVFKHVPSKFQIN